MWQSSLLPDSYDMAEMGYVDWGGGPVDEHHGMGHGTPVKDLVADPDRPADVRETLTVHVEDDHYTVNGTSPGPTLEATVGDLVEVTLVNDNVDDGITLHWHGVDVPNAEDGVAGVTQDAVLAGEEYVYRFVAEDAGTYWYHSHQVSHEQVRRGLLGALVIHPEVADPETQEALAVLHRYADGATLNGEEGTTTVDAEPGQAVRLRVVNTDNGLASLWVTGAPYRVLAVDGRDVNQPGEIDGEKYGLPAGGRVDLGFVVPEDGIRVDFGGSTTLVFGADPTAGDEPRAPEESVDLLTYGEPADIGFDPASRTGGSTTGSAGDPASWTVGPACSGRSTATCSPTSRCTWSARATSSSSRSTTAAATTIRCTCTGTTRSCSPGTASRPAAVPGGWTPSRSRTARPTRSRSWPTTPASGWTTATTCRTRRRGWSRT